MLKYTQRKTTFFYLNLLVHLGMQVNFERCTEHSCISFPCKLYLDTMGLFPWHNSINYKSTGWVVINFLRQEVDNNYFSENRSCASILNSDRLITALLTCCMCKKKLHWSVFLQDRGGKFVLISHELWWHNAKIS